jgi:hypothetical protein
MGAYFAFEGITHVYFEETISCVHFMLRDILPPSDRSSHSIKGALKDRHRNAEFERDHASARALNGSSRFPNVTQNIDDPLFPSLIYVNHVTHN